MNKVPNNVEDDIKVLLDNLREPSIVIPLWLQALVAEVQQQRPELNQYRAFLVVMDEVLNELRNIRRDDDVKLLTGRYWVGLTQKQMVDAGSPRPVRERRFNELQKEAIERFTLLLWQRVELLKVSASSESADTSRLPQQVRKLYRLASWRFYAGLVALVATSLILFVGWRLYSRIYAATCDAQITVDARDGTFLRAQGLTSFNPENTHNGILHSNVRALAVDKRGVWFGLFPGEQNLASSFGLYNKKEWMQCRQEDETQSKNINAIQIMDDGTVWIATEQSGVVKVSGNTYIEYTVQEGLPDNKTYDIAIDQDNSVWVATWEGIARFDGQHWSVPYTKGNGSLSSTSVHALAFDEAGNMWVGYIDGGVSQYRKSDRTWSHFTTQTSGLGGNAARNIVVAGATSTSPEAIWIATGDGGVSKFEDGAWTVFDTDDGLPSNDVPALAIDKYRRIWAGTSKGASYFDGSKWNTYDTLNTLSIGFGPDCERCPYDDEHVWTGTVGSGVTHSRIPYPEPAIDIVSVTYPHIVKPDQAFCPQILVRPRKQYMLQQGDFLAFAEESDTNLFDAFPRIEVKRTVIPGEEYAFENCAQPFRAPALAESEQQRTLVSKWRLWMSGRYVEPAIVISFSVQQP